MGADRVGRILRGHAAYAWNTAAQALVGGIPLVGIAQGSPPPAAPTLCIAEGIAFDPGCAPRTADCFGTELIMLHPLQLGDFPGFAPVPGCAWVWRTADGAVMPAFNIAGFIERYLDGGEERAVTARDDHGRLPLAESTLFRAGLAHRPLLNHYLFAAGRGERAG